MKDDAHARRGIGCRVDSGAVATGCGVRVAAQANRVERTRDLTLAMNLAATIAPATIMTRAFDAPRDQVFEQNGEVSRGIEAMVSPIRSARPTCRRQI